MKATSPYPYLQGKPYNTSALYLVDKTPKP